MQISAADDANEDYPNEDSVSNQNYYEEDGDVSISDGRASILSGLYFVCCILM